jgi:hypothetical protein
MRARPNLVIKSVRQTISFIAARKHSIVFFTKLQEQIRYICSASNTTRKRDGKISDFKQEFFVCWLTQTDDFHVV